MTGLRAFKIVCTLLILVVAWSVWAAPLWLTWDEDPAADRYRVYFNSHGGSWEECEAVVTEINQIPDPVPEPLPGQIYFIVVTGENSKGEGGTGHGLVVQCTGGDSSADGPQTTNPNYQERTE